MIEMCAFVSMALWQEHSQCWVQGVTKHSLETTGNIYFLFKISLQIVSFRISQAWTIDSHTTLGWYAIPHFTQCCPKKGTCQIIYIGNMCWMISTWVTLYTWNIQINYFKTSNMQCSVIPEILKLIKHRTLNTIQK